MSNPRDHHLVRLAVSAGGAVPMLIGCLWLAAWFTGVAQEWSAAGSTITMKTNLALALALAGLALLLLACESAGAWRRSAGRLAAALVTVIGALTLVEYLFGSDLGIDQLLAREAPGAPGTSSPNRMGPFAAVSATFGGAGLLALGWRMRTLSPALGLAMGIVILVPAVGYLYGIQELYSRPGVTGIAWSSVAALAFLGGGLIAASPQRGPLAVLLRADAGGALFRRYLPASVALPLVLGWITTAGQHRALYNPDLSSGLLVILLILLLGGLLWRSTAKLSQSAAAEAKSQAELRAQREWLRVTLNSIGDAVITCDTSARVTFLNPVAEGLTGWTRGKALGQPLEKVFRALPEQTGEPVPNSITRVLVNKETITLADTSVLVTRDERTIPIDESAAPILDDAGIVQGAVLVFRDVAAKRRAEQALQSTALFPEENPFPVLRTAADGTLLYANHAADPLLEEWHCQAGEAAPEFVRQAAATALQGGGRQQLNLRCGERDICLMLVPIAGRNYVNLYGLDMTERKRAEAALEQAKRSVESERNLLQSVMDGARKSHLVFLDRDFNFVRVNETYARSCGYTPEELIGKNHFALYPNAENQALFARVRDTGVPLEVHDKPFVFPDQPERGVTYWDWTLQPIEHEAEGVKGFVLSLVETTERQRAEQALRQSEARFKLLADVSARLLRAEEPQKVVQEICHSVMHHLGCDCFFNFLADEISGRLRLNACAGVPRSEAARLEWLEYGASVCGCVGRDGQGMVAEDIQCNADPRTELVKSYGVQAYSCQPLRAPGQIIGTLSFGSRSRTSFGPEELELMSSVSDQVAVAMQRLQAHATLQSAKDQLARVNQELEQKVQERTARLRETITDLEQFSYSIAHDLRAPLRSMSSFSTVLLEDCHDKLDDQAVDYLRRIASAAKRMDDLIRDVLSYSRVVRSDASLTPVDLDGLVRDIVEQYPQFSSDRVEIDIVSPLHSVAGNPALLTQCISNLLGNAAKFVNGEIKPHIRIWTSQADGWLRLHVQDNGIGIEASQLDRIWRIFERAHDPKSYDGTGIGLSVVKRAIERMGGKVGVESTPGEGSTFWLQLAKA